MTQIRVPLSQIESAKDSGHYQRTFMGRMPRSYSHVQYELWDAHTGKTTHPTVDLGQILDNYDLQASGFLAGILQSMRAQWP